MKNLNYLSDHIMCQIFKIYFEYNIKKYQTVIDNPSIRIPLNKMDDKTIFRINTGYCLELLTPETINLLGSTKSKMTKDKNAENVPHLEITEAVIKL